MLRLSPARSRTSLSDLATLTPPPFPRPPAWICAFTAQTLPPSSRAAFAASSTEKQGTPRGVATPYLRRISFAWYSWIFIARPSTRGMGLSRGTAPSRIDAGQAYTSGGVESPGRFFRRHAPSEVRSCARPGHDQLARHRVRRARAPSRRGAKGIPPALPPARLGRARCRRDFPLAARLRAHRAQESEARPLA